MTEQTQGKINIKEKFYDVQFFLGNQGENLRCTKFLSLDYSPLNTKWSNKSTT